jgi:hypothetical protein
MRSRLLALAAVSVAVTGCGGGPPAPAGLAYSLPDPPAVTYTTADTALMDIDAGGQAFQVDVATSSTLGATFARVADGVRVSLEVKKLSGSQSNPMGAPVTADASGISGPLVFSLDRRGVATVVSQPEVQLSAQTFFQPLAVAHTFFPRLPGRAARAGDAWTDTIHYEGPQGAGSVNTTAVMKYTVMGDTLVGGRSLVKIGVEGSADSRASGSFGGMDFSQNMSGTTTGWVLWDLGRSLMTEMFDDSDAKGSMDVSAASFPLTVHVRGRSRARLAPER